MPTDKTQGPGGGIADQVQKPKIPVSSITEQLSDIPAKVAEKIKASESILVALSQDPSVDEISAALGLTLLLDKLGKHVTAIYSGETPNTLEFLRPGDTFEKDTNSLQDFIIAINKEKADHLRYKIEGDYVKVYITPYRTMISEADLEFDRGDYNVDLVITIDVDSGESIDGALAEYGRIMHDATAVNITVNPPGHFAETEWSEVSKSSVCEMIVDLADKLEFKDFDPDLSTTLLTGIVASTDRFSNERTTPEAMSVASRLMSTGADQKLISSNIMSDVVIAPAPEPEPEPEPAPAPEIDPTTAAISAATAAVVAANEAAKNADATPSTDTTTASTPAAAPTQTPTPAAPAADEPQPLTETTDLDIPEAPTPAPASAPTTPVSIPTPTPASASAPASTPATATPSLATPSVPTATIAPITPDLAAASVPTSPAAALPAEISPIVSQPGVNPAVAAAPTLAPTFDDTVPVMQYETIPQPVTTPIAAPNPLVATRPDPIPTPTAIAPAPAPTTPTMTTPSPTLVSTPVAPESVLPSTTPEPTLPTSTPEPAFPTAPAAPEVSAPLAIPPVPEISYTSISPEPTIPTAPEPTIPSASPTLATPMAPTVPEPASAPASTIPEPITSPTSVSTMSVTANPEFTYPSLPETPETTAAPMTPPTFEPMHEEGVAQPLSRNDIVPLEAPAPAIPPLPDFNTVPPVPQIDFTSPSMPPEIPSSPDFQSGAAVATNPFATPAFANSATDPTANPFAHPATISSADVEPASDSAPKAVSYTSFPPDPAAFQIPGEFTGFPPAQPQQ